MVKKQSRHSCLPGIAALAVLAACTPTRDPVIYDSGRQQQEFTTPEQAVDTLVAATRKDDKAALLKALGPRAAPLISSGDPVADQEGRKKFLASYDTKHQLENATPDRDILLVGKERWPWPIPLLRQDDRWWFDTEAGVQEILDRRIGRNELNVIEVCRVYVDAQLEYADLHVSAGGTREYASRFISHDGKHDGLYWPANEGGRQSPLGSLIAYAQSEGYDPGPHRKPAPYHGYYYKILKAQSAAAPGGALHYVSGGHMTKGFALLAFPATYGDSGIMTFIVNQNGIVYEKDLGPDTEQVAAKIKIYNPDKSWKLP